VPTEPEVELVATWFGSFLVERGRVVRESRFPEGAEARGERLRTRRSGKLAPEEEALASSGLRGPWLTRDRRFERLGGEWTQRRPARVSLTGPGWEALRTLLLAEAETSLQASWDPSVHLDEAVRAMADVDRVRNLLGERLASWAMRDRPDLPEDETDSGELAMKAVLEDSIPNPWTALPEGDPSLLAVRRVLASSFRSLGELRRSLEGAVDEAATRRLPNLSNLLGPTLSARMVSQAGGLDRLARLPSSTVQVLGAEKAFFDHLRRGSRPPRHGLLFLHPKIQGAPRKTRGRLARALAGKVSIAARLDQAGRPVNESLAEAFHRRSEEIGRPRSKGTRPGSRPSGLPLDRATEDR
jgi:nucleolar protein 56